MDKRPELDDIFMLIAELMAARSTCSAKKSVGAVLVTGDRRIIATGYAGSPIGFPHCNEVGCDDDGHNHRVIHAEENTLLQCARIGISTVGTVLYTTWLPCQRCAARIVQAGVVEVVYKYGAAEQHFNPPIEEVNEYLAVLQILNYGSVRIRQKKEIHYDYQRY